ncbi:MAG: FAD-binding oxidoreductase [Acetobacteraceae bacterium]
MNRRELLSRAGAVPLLPLVWSGWPTPARAAAPPVRRVRPSDLEWPTQARWDTLNQDVGGHLIKVASPFDACRDAPGGAACREFFKALTNPYYIRDQAGLTQTSGWVDAWTSLPSAYAVAARNTADVVAAVNFARENNLRLVVKGGGHSYQGTSDAPDSLLVWTRQMDAIALHDAFVGAGCAGTQAPQPAVTVEAGAIWMHTYDAVTTKGGRYVQGGGCATVGVAGLIQSGGFGSFSKNYGAAAAGLLEAEVVTADGVARIANACTNPDLFWGIKGGGGGSLGFVTRLTLRTRELPDVFGAAFGTIRASSDAAFRRLIKEFISFYADRLFNRHWGESVTFRPDNTLEIHMAFQGLSRQPASAVWQPFIDAVVASPRDFPLVLTPRIVAVPARSFWDPAYMATAMLGLLVADDRPGAPADNVLYGADRHEAGQFISGYGSAWLPAALLNKDQQGRLADALFAATRHWQMALHFNKGLAGAPADEVRAARDTAMNPAVLDAFALAICGATGPASFPAIHGHEPDLATSRRRANAVSQAMDEMLKLVPDAGSYVSESDFFNKNWQQAFWGSNYKRLAGVKKAYDPAGLFFVHHGVGSEEWSADGFTRLA